MALKKFPTKYKKHCLKNSAKQMTHHRKYFLYYSFTFIIRIKFPLSSIKAFTKTINFEKNWSNFFFVLLSC
jgi:hypothetical protein